MSQCIHLPQLKNIGCMTQVYLQKVKKVNQNGLPTQSHSCYEISEQPIDQMEHN